MLQTGQTCRSTTMGTISVLSYMATRGRHGVIADDAMLDEEDGLEMPFIPPQYRDDSIVTGETMEQQQLYQSSSARVVEGPQKIWEIYSQFTLHHPLLTNMASTGLIGVVGDATAQILQGRKSLNMRRLLAYGSIMVFFSAPFVHFWFRFLERILHRVQKTDLTNSNHKLKNWTTDLSTALKMVVLDQLIAAPICTNCM